MLTRTVPFGAMDPLIVAADNEPPRSPKSRPVRQSGAHHRRRSRDTEPYWKAILGPSRRGNLGGYANPVPDGYIVLRPATFGGYALLRSNLNHGEADVARPPEQLRSSVMTESPESILRRLSDDCTQLEMAVAMEGREPPQWLFVEDIFILNQRLSRLFGTILEAQLEHLTSTRLGGRSS
jgi:hypothetical protein